MGNNSKLLLIALLTALPISSLCGQQARRTVQEHTMVRIQLAADEDATVDPVKPIDNVIDEEQTENALLWTAPPGLYRVSIIAITDGKFDRSRRRRELVEVVAGDPDHVDPVNPVDPVVPVDPVKPAPRPDGQIAGAAYDQAIAVKQGSKSLAVGKAMAVVAGKLDEQSNVVSGVQHYKTPADAKADLIAQLTPLKLGAGWKPFLGWMATTCNANARTFDGIQTTLEEMSLGLRRAGGDSQ